jgi:hypothetical protein
LLTLSPNAAPESSAYGSKGEHPENTTYCRFFRTVLRFVFALVLTMNYNVPHEDG